MASYGIGPARIVAAAVEQFADEHGIAWPRALAPFAVQLVALGKPGTPERDAADRALRDASRRRRRRSLRRPRARPRREVRRRRAARLPAAADRRPAHARVGRDRGAAAPRPRGGARSGARRRAHGAAAGRGRAVAQRPVGEDGARQDRGRRPALHARRVSRRRAVSRRRGCSGSTARARRRRRRRAAVRCARGRSRTRSASSALALIPVFLVVALSSSDGVDALAATLFAVIGWGDYADGIAARVTRPVQPARRADGPGHRPPAGRLAASSSAGTSTCCRAGRWRCWPCASWRCSCSAATARARRGAADQLAGRLAVAPVMGSFFFALVGLGKARRSDAVRRPRAGAGTRPRCTLRRGLDELRAQAPPASLKLSLTLWSILRASCRRAEPARRRKPATRR